jgi:hypothetical protein
MRLANVGAAPNRLRGCPTRCADPVWTKPRGQEEEGRPTTTHHHGFMAIATALPRLLMAAAAPAMACAWLPHNVVIVDNDRGDSPSSYRARALRAAGLMLRSTGGAPRYRLKAEHMQGGSRCPGPAVVSQSARGGMTRC